MDTLVTVNVVSDSADRAEKAMDNAFDEIAKLDSMLNFFSDKSELSMINKNAGISEVRVSQETIEVIEKAVYVSEKTGGAFDATIGPEISLWDFPNKIKPDDKTIRERLSLVNYKLIHINKEKSTVYLGRKGMLLDLGGIAKGYAADRAVEELKKHGIKSGLVSVAGDIKAFGLKPDGKAWKIGIRNPRATGNDNEIMATIELRDMAVSTSGDYERYFIMDGKRYHHILDPKTGYPALGCQSVTVIAKDGVYTDSFSTGVFVLGPERGMAALKEMGFEGLIVDSNGSIQTTSGLKDRIEFKKDHR
ncbi:MAG: FAD:protein FMN transferase [Thermodesulfovibrionales bacterium]